MRINKFTLRMIVFYFFITLISCHEWDSGGSLDNDNTKEDIRIGSEFKINTYTEYDQYTPMFSMDKSGNFVVVWSSDVDQDGDDMDIFARRFSWCLFPGHGTAPACG